jgi:hypothetical protein
MRQFLRIRDETINGQEESWVSTIESFERRGSKTYIMQAV